jgi:two-component system CheB/CheR fusion protein
MLIRQLEEQLRITHEQLQATSEQLETSNESFLSANEELMSINEEFQSTNEELQSTNEELETSKEELQALNEELVTVNAELQGKVEELNQSNGDMENLFASSEIAAIFLDRGLIIKRYSPAMSAIFNLISADIGRPFRHLAGTIDWPDLPRDAQAVLDKLVPIEREVTTLEDGRCFIMRVLPYRTTLGVIDGIVVTLIDITERKRMEAAHAQLAALVESSDDAIIAKDLSGIILSWNSGAERLYGYRADEVIGKPITLLAPPELQAEEEQILRRLAAGERIEHFETVRLTRDGRRVEVSVTASPIKDSQGRIVGASKIARDITMRKLAEEALRRAKEEWERTFASVPDMIAILDNDHQVMRVNDAMARRLGLKPDDCVGLRCYEAIHGATAPPAFCPHSRTLKDGREHIEELHEDRLRGDFVVTTTPLLDERGERIGSVHIAHDITERKKMEDVLRERENRYRELVQNANSAIIRWKREGTIVFFNEFAQKFFGYDLEEVLGKKVAILLPERESSGGDLSGLLKDIVEHPERFVNNVNENVLKDGRRVWMAWTNRPILDEQGGVAEILAVGIDITERKLAEDALHASYEELERFNRATVGRELRMVDLKKEVNELCGRVGEPARYKLDFGEEP